MLPISAGSFHSISRPINPDNQQVPYQHGFQQQAQSREGGAPGKESRNCFRLSIVSFLLAVISIIITILMYLIVDALTYYEYDIYEIWFYVNVVY
ncbi:MAG: hypothetical protein BAJALOKI1v1_70006 [Promethearchaeota archaeon]|nr:MAG: hypothetical protein BAJALOKI1v1_70006 [Candidatus Lokiarchaeota archaeon]